MTDDGRPTKPTPRYPEMTARDVGSVIEIGYASRLMPPGVIPGPSPDARFRDPLDWEDEDDARSMDEIWAEK